MFGIFDKAKDDRRRAKWNPKPDITAYELAQITEVLILGLTGGYRNVVKRVEELPKDAQRHFEIFTENERGTSK